jgi:hypothetical protein
MYSGSLIVYITPWNGQRAMGYTESFICPPAHIVQSPSTHINLSEVLHQNSAITLSKLTTMQGFYSNFLQMQSLIGSFPLILLILILGG